MTDKARADPDEANPDLSDGTAAFDLESFLPYLLNQAAEAASKSFQTLYKADYGMTRTQWRVLANLGKFGAMTARDICAISHIEKTKVSRAVAALEQDGLLSREPSPTDRRSEVLALTGKGNAVFAVLGKRALAFDTALRLNLGPELASTFERLLRQLAAFGAKSSGGDLD